MCKTGAPAFIMSKYRPPCAVIVVSADEKVGLTASPPQSMAASMLTRLLCYINTSLISTATLTSHFNFIGTCNQVLRLMGPRFGLYSYLAKPGEENTDTLLKAAIQFAL